MEGSGNKDRLRVILLIAGSMSVIAGIAFWLKTAETKIKMAELMMIIAVILVVLFALFLAYRRIREMRQKLPAEDEMSKIILRKGAATAYYLSLYMWLALMMFDDVIDLERHTLIGSGIMGMTVIFALSWLYHRYFTKVQ